MFKFIKPAIIRTKHWGKKNAPTILTVVGSICITVGSVWACVKAVKNVQKINNERDIELEALDRRQESLSDREYNHELKMIYIRYFARMAYNFSGPAALQIGGLGLIFKGQGMLITEIGSLGTLLSRKTKECESLEEAIRKQYGDEVLAKLKVGEPIGQLIESTEEETVANDIYKDPEGWDFYWGPGDRGFSKSDPMMNHKTVKDAVTYFKRSQEPYRDGIRVNDIYRFFGISDKITKENDILEMGYPSRAVGDYEFEGFDMIPLDKNGNPCNTDPSIRYSYGYLMKFKTVPIPLREMNIEGGFRKS